MEASKTTGKLTSKVRTTIPLAARTALRPKDGDTIADGKAGRHLSDPLVKAQVAAPGKPVERIDQGVHFVNQGDKAKLLDSWGCATASIHGNESRGKGRCRFAGGRSRHGWGSVGARHPAGAACLQL